MEAILCNSIELFRFINDPVPSNTYLLVDFERSECVIIDPGSKYPTEIASFILENTLTLKYIILTHEHFDHCWGANCLQDMFCSTIVATKRCAEWLSVPMNYYNKLYFNSEETYSVKVGIIVENIGWKLNWNDCLIIFHSAKGHTDKGMYVAIGDNLFTGDSLLLNTKPFIKKRYGGSVVDLYYTITSIFDNYPENSLVYPGHGMPFFLKEAKSFYLNYFNEIKIQHEQLS